MISRSSSCSRILVGMILSILLAGCSTFRENDPGAERIEVFHYALNATSPIAMRPTWIIERNSKTMVTIVDKGAVSEIETSLANAIEHGRKERGIVDARIVALFQHKDSTADTLCLSRLQFSYKGQSYRRDSALLNLIVSHLGPDRQSELREIFSRSTTSRSAVGIPFSGRVTDQATGAPLRAAIVVENLNTGANVLNVTSDSVTGVFGGVLAPGNAYGISVSAQRYVFESARYTIPYDPSYDTVYQDFRLVKLAQGQSFATQNIMFGYNTATFEPEFRPELDRIVAMMKEYGSMRIEINGHTDNVGPEEFCKKLSLARAEAVREYLVSMGGISPDRLTTRGFGDSKPVASNSTEQGRRQNRRVEFMILQY